MAERLTINVGDTGCPPYFMSTRSTAATTLRLRLYSWYIEFMHVRQLECIRSLPETAREVNTIMYQREQLPCCWLSQLLTTTPRYVLRGIHESASNCDRPAFSRGGL